MLWTMVWILRIHLVIFLVLSWSPQCPLKRLVVIVLFSIFPPVFGMSDGVISSLLPNPPSRIYHLPIALLCTILFLRLALFPLT